MEQITTLRDLLPHGAQKEIAAKLNTSALRVNRVLGGKIEDLAIVEAIIDYYIEYKAKKEATIKRIAALA